MNPAIPDCHQSSQATPLRILALTSIACLFTLFTADAALVGHWPLDQNADDAGANGLDGMLVGAPDSVIFDQPGATTNTGQSAAFEGGNIDIPWDSRLNTNSFTVTLWAFPTVAGDGNFRSPITNREHTEGSVTHGWIIYTNPDGNWTFWNGLGVPGWDLLDDGPVDVNQWTHLAITYDGDTNTKNIYVNGALEGTQEPPSFDANTGDFDRAIHIGSGDDGGGLFRWEGRIDDVGVWDEILDEATINTLMTNGIGNDTVDPNLGITNPIDLTLDGSIQTFNIPVQNNGETKTLVVSTADFTGEHAAKFSVVSIPGPIAPGGNDKLVISVDPGADNGIFNATLNIESNDSLNSDVAVTITATLHEPRLDTPDSVTFGPFPPQPGPQSASIEIRNLGTLRPLNISAATVSGDNADQFSITEFPTSIPVGGTGQLDITFTPGDRDGLFFARIDLTSDDPINPASPIGLLASIEVTDPLVAYWPLDEDGSDLSGNNHNGEILPDVEFGLPGASPNTGTSAEFLGGNIDVPFDPSLNTNDYTVTLWAYSEVADGSFRSPITNREHVREDNNDLATTGWMIYNTPGGVWSFWNGQGIPGWPALNDTTPISISQWYHLGITFDSATSTKSLYVDGILTGTQTTTYAPRPGDNGLALHIGSGDDGGTTFRWEGRLDDVAVFRTALPEEEILKIMTDGMGRFIGAPPFVITNIQRDAILNQITITWNSKPDTFYAVERSTNLADWEELDDSVPALGPSAQFTDTTLPENTPAMHYRILGARP